jgi:hypothetical protein
MWTFRRARLAFGKIAGVKLNRSIAKLAATRNKERFTWWMIHGELAG